MSMPPKPDTPKSGSNEPEESVKNITERAASLEIKDSHGKDTKQRNDKTPENKSKGNKTKRGPQRKLKFTQNDGEYMKDHPWEPVRPMSEYISESAVYKVDKNWKHWGKVDLGKIYEHLPQFVKEMKGKTCRQELEEVVERNESLDTEGSETEASANEDTDEKDSDTKGSGTEASVNIDTDKEDSDTEGLDTEASDTEASDTEASDTEGSETKASANEGKDKEDSGNEGSVNNSSTNKDMKSGGSETKASENLTPHVKEVVDKLRGKDQSKDKPDLPRKEKESFRAYSFPPQQEPPQKPNIWFLDCEYMCKVHLPHNTSHWLDDSDKSGKRIRAIKPDKINQRWIFTPSFRRAKIALLDWPEDQIQNSGNTIRILVVRPTEFEEYVKYCGDKFHIISLPNDEIGAGYPRLWIQKIALRLKLNFIWMIDDSVRCFYEYHPKDGKGTKHSPERRRKFGIVFQSIEQFVQRAKSDASPIAAMSPGRYRGVKPTMKKQIVCRSPRIAVYLNLEALKSRDIYYRPELQVLEDMVFGYECEKNGLKVFMDNRIHLQDRKWRDTGARSSSVQQKMKEESKANTTT
ncbi:uncharacterized protein LOC111332196 [Stylophora pistillata]|uniref:TET-Associated Glycosyltransferase domain-containing protein n=1 Tax=Stylophora pistillata TaxID=50429 RepID=A0A2B4S665_STYPI|nr:uncharacterized protein LOC111332196 [Stylophora pistillata]PFX24048.1 hypothetical protein AWC38_SpisGene11391 [Stylophora pistillata]